MGGGHERVIHRNIGGEAGVAALATFDAAKAQCFLQTDREKLLAVVEAGFGDLEPFNKAVCQLLGQSPPKRARLMSLSLSSLGGTHPKIAPKQKTRREERKSGDETVEGEESSSTPPSMPPSS